MIDSNLDEVVGRILGTGVVRVSPSRRDPLDYDPFLAGRSLVRVSGTAPVNGRSRTWSFIEKVTAGPAVASAYLYDNGLREARAYRSGLLSDLADGVSAPIPYAVREGEGGTLILWLEDVGGAGRWTPDDYTAAARHLGRLAGRWLDRVPDHSWLFTDWIERHSQSPAVAPALDALRTADQRRPLTLRVGRGLDEAVRLIEDQATYRSVLERLPHTLCHHDAVRANLFSRGRAGARETVLIDWEMVGPGPVGADLASLLFSSVRRGDLSASWLPELQPRALGAYAQGIADTGASVHQTELRLGFSASVSLRWTLIRDVVAATEPDGSIFRGSARHESSRDALEQLITLTRTLFAAADEVRHLAPP